MAFNMTDMTGVDTNMSDASNATFHICFANWSAFNVLTTIFYTAIFLTSIIGNTMVIITILQSAQMRTVTNMFLLNLSISDLLLSMFCMPTSLVGKIFRCFLFGDVMCVGVFYLQAVSITASAYTLVAIAIERFFAIVMPLRSRVWQTKSHAYRMIAGVWTISLIFNMPFFWFAKNQNFAQNAYNCIVQYPDSVPEAEFIHTAVIIFIMFMLPLIVMVVFYSLVIITLYDGMKVERANNFQTSKSRCSDVSLAPKSEIGRSAGPSKALLEPTPKQLGVPQNNSRKISTASIIEKPGGMALRSTNAIKSLQSKKRVIKMLITIVVEFFVCWIPLYAVVIAYMIGWFNQYVHSIALAFAYVSSCTNPITYCFMNTRFRSAFLAAIRCNKNLLANINHSTFTPQAHQAYSVNMPTLNTRRSSPSAGTRIGESPLICRYDDMRNGNYPSVTVT